MTFHAPRILDAKGREIRVGDRVRLTDEPSLPEPGEVVGFLPGRVVVEWTDRDRTGDDYPAAAASTPATYTCPDLQLLDDREETSNGN